jgi:nitrate reductase (NAD(P)H)
MPLPAPAQPRTLSNHPGSSAQEIEEEPAWGRGHEHRTGYRNRWNRVPGLTFHEEDGHDEEEEKFVEEANAKEKDLRDRVKKGELVDFQDVMKDQTVRVDHI